MGRVGRMKQELQRWAANDSESSSGQQMTERAKRGGCRPNDRANGEASRRGHGPVFIEKTTTICLTLAVTGDSNRAQ
jgi:hypothetical protein